jgi:hypothetical protein
MKRWMQTILPIIGVIAVSRRGNGSGATTLLRKILTVVIDPLVKTSRTKEREWLGVLESLKMTRVKKTWISFSHLKMKFVPVRYVDLCSHSSPVFICSLKKTQKRKRSGQQRRVNVEGSQDQPRPRKAVCHFLYALSLNVY